MEKAEVAVYALEPGSVVPERVTGPVPASWPRPRGPLHNVWDFQAHQVGRDGALIVTPEGTYYHSGSGGWEKVEVPEGMMSIAGPSEKIANARS